MTKALVVTQPYHLARAVALCRHLGLDADGVGARCDGCLSLNLMRNWTRDYFACSKAALEAYRAARPRSPPSRVRWSRKLSHVPSRVHLWSPLRTSGPSRSHCHARPNT